MFALWYISLALEEIRKKLGWTSFSDFFSSKKAIKDVPSQDKPKTTQNDNNVTNKTEVVKPKSFDKIIDIPKIPTKVIEPIIPVKTPETPKPKTPETPIVTPQLPKKIEPIRTPEIPKPKTPEVIIPPKVTTPVIPPNTNTVKPQTPAAPITPPTPKIPNVFDANNSPFGKMQEPFGNGHSDIQKTNIKDATNDFLKEEGGPKNKPETPKRYKPTSQSTAL